VASLNQYARERYRLGVRALAVRPSRVDAALAA
jgi:hypothetical protein